MATRMLQRRGTPAEWSSLNPVLGDGELGIERGTGILKAGDGVSVWTSLPQPFVTKQGGDIITASGASVIPLVLKMGPGQTANVFEARNSANEIVVRIDNSGGIRSIKPTGNAFGSDDSFGATVGVISAGATSKALVVRGAASQSGLLTDYQNNAGTSLASVDSAGAFRGNAFAAGGLLQAGTTVLDASQQMLVSIGSDSRRGLVVKMASAQSANAIEIFDGSGSSRTALTAAGRLNLHAFAPGQSTALISARASGNNLEFGHGNQAGYGSVLGSENGSGMPAIVFLGEHGTVSNTYTSRGFKPFIMRANASGELEFSTIAASAVNTSATRKAMIHNDGQYTVNPDAVDVFAGRARFGPDPAVRRMQMTNAGDYGSSMSILAGVYGGTGSPGIIIRSGASAHDGTGTIVLQDSAGNGQTYMEPIGRIRMGMGNAGGLGIGSAGGNTPLDRPLIALTNTSQPSNYGGGGAIYCESGTLRYRGELGSITQLASA